MLSHKISAFKHSYLSDFFVFSRL